MLVTVIVYSFSGAKKIVTCLSCFRRLFSCESDQRLSAERSPAVRKNKNGNNRTNKRLYNYAEIL